MYMRNILGYYTYKEVKQKIKQKIVIRLREANESKMWRISIVMNNCTMRDSKLRMSEGNGLRPYITRNEYKALNGLMNGKVVGSGNISCELLEQMNGKSKAILFILFQEMCKKG